MEGHFSCAEQGGGVGYIVEVLLGYGVFVVTKNRGSGVCYGFINPEVNHFVFWIRGCSRSKVFISC